ncbi:hypothetical protein HN011_007142 [Eciton burchellii]|nr:hypothetical protein HN011_007142 [Eciton burchellii]
MSSGRTTARCESARTRSEQLSCQSQISYRLRGSSEIRIAAVWLAWHAMRYVKKRAVNYEDNSESCVCVPHITSFRLREFLHASQSALNPPPDRCTLSSPLPCPFANVPTIGTIVIARTDLSKEATPAVRKKRALRRESRSANGRSPRTIPNPGLRRTGPTPRSDYRLFRKLKTRAASFVSSKANIACDLQFPQTRADARASSSALSRAFHVLHCRGSIGEC